jgi:hypothetical protein
MRRLTTIKMTKNVECLFNIVFHKFLGLFLSTVNVMIWLMFSLLIGFKVITLSRFYFTTVGLINGLKVKSSRLRPFAQPLGLIIFDKIETKVLNFRYRFYRVWPL